MEKGGSVCFPVRSSDSNKIKTLQGSLMELCFFISLVCHRHYPKLLTFYDMNMYYISK